MRTARRLRHWANLLLNADYRAARNQAQHSAVEKARLARLPRFTRTTTDLLGTPVLLVDAPSFLWTYEEVFDNRIYEFSAESSTPYIIDGGANIGLSVLFFKSLYPHARITCFEPDEDIRAVLQRNIASLADVTVEPFALAPLAAVASFVSDGADGGRLAAAGIDRQPTRVVRTVRLRDYLDRQVDMLKLDIEGSETEVLLDSADRLHFVRRVYTEYHSFADRPQTLHLLLGVLHDAGFRIHVTPAAVSRQPFVRPRSHPAFDMQLHVFGYRVDDVSASPPVQQS